MGIDFSEDIVLHFLKTKQEQTNITDINVLKEKPANVFYTEILFTMTKLTENLDLLWSQSSQPGQKT